MVLITKMALAPNIATFSIMTPDYTMSQFSLGSILRKILSLEMDLRSSICLEIIVLLLMFESGLFMKMTKLINPR